MTNSCDIRSIAVAIDALMPLGGLLDRNGRLVHAGRTLSRAFPDLVVGQDLFGTFRLTSHDLLHWTTLGELCDQQLDLLAMVNQSLLTWRAQIVPISTDRTLFAFNMTAGKNLPAVVDALALRDTDFSHTDLCVDLLEILQVQADLISDSQALAERLRNSKNVAEKRANTDTLTGLASRHAIVTCFDDNQGVGGNAAVRLMQIDLDRFKQVNDAFGHAAGDAVLIKVAALIQKRLGPRDMAARMGGDEFVLILHDQPDDDAVRALADDLISDISVPMAYGDQWTHVTASIGITTIRPGTHSTLDNALLEADLALYEAKMQGRGCARCFTDRLHRKHAFDQNLGRDIEKALESGEFQPHFQMQIDGRTGHPYGAEVLARWHHPRHGILGPGKFVPTAQRTRLMQRIDDQISRAALAAMAQWHRAGIAPDHIALNVTAERLSDQDFPDDITRQVAEHGLSPSQIVFELVESILIDGAGNDLRDAALTLIDRGFRLALDDFGTGRASIASLVAVPVALVKIDRAFVAGVDKQATLKTLSHAMVQLCDNLNIEVMAEGVETPAERDQLAEMGCQYFQGFLFHRPQAADAFTDVLRAAHAGEPPRRRAGRS